MGVGIQNEEEQESDCQWEKGEEVIGTRIPADEDELMESDP